MGTRDWARTRIGRRWALAPALAVLTLGLQAGGASAATKAPSWSYPGWGSGGDEGAATAISCVGSTCNAVGSYLTVTTIVSKNSGTVGVGPAALAYKSISCVPGFCAQTAQAFGKTFAGSQRRMITIEATATSGPTFKVGPLDPYFDSQLASISCVKGRDCLAVGAAQHVTVTDCKSSMGTYDGKPLCIVQVPLAVERIDGHWRQIATIPLPVTPVAMILGYGTGAWGSLAGVSCVSASACVAVGNYGTSSNASEPFAESWNGKAFTEVPMVTVTGASTATVNSISCSKSGSCLAVGVATVGSKRLSFAEQLAGGVWKLVTPVQPTGAQGSTLLSVSCVRSGWCMTVGNKTLKSGTVRPLAEIWNGSKFVVTAFAANVAYPTTKGDARLAGVSCTAKNHCDAIGNVYGATGKLNGWFLSSYAAS